MWLLAVVAAGCGRPAPFALGSTVRAKLAVDGVERQYLLTLPSAYDPDHKYPLVLGFHGWSSDAEDQAAYDGFAQKAKKGRLIAVHPEGMADAPTSWKHPYQGWSAVGSSMASGNGDDLCVDSTGNGTWPCYTSCGTCSHCSYATCADDVGFVEQLLNELENKLCVDTAKVFAHGCSNGGQMVLELLQSRLAARFAGLVSEVALPHAGRLKPPGAEVRFLGLWGDRDRVMPAKLKLGENRTLSNDGFYYSGASTVTDSLAHAFGCSTARHSVVTRATRNNLRCEEHACAKGTDVVQCFFDGGHIWPKVAHSLIFQFYFQDFRAHRILLRSERSALLAEEDTDGLEFVLPSGAVQ